jgi:hypothetical protein
MNQRMQAAAGLVTAIVVLVGIYDIAIGGVMLLAPEPWLAHGPGTGWIALGAQLAGDPSDPTLGLFRRMGAFSLHAGVCTVVWSLLAHRRLWLQSALFATYLTTGMGFALTDARFFADTTYLTVKHGIGTAFFVAFLLHLWLRWQQRRAASDAPQP